MISRETLFAICSVTLLLGSALYFAFRAAGCTSLEAGAYTNDVKSIALIAVVVWMFVVQVRDLLRSRP